MAADNSRRFTAKPFPAPRGMVMRDEAPSDDRMTAVACEKNPILLDVPLLLLGSAKQRSRCAPTRRSLGTRSDRVGAASTHVRLGRRASISQGAALAFANRAKRLKDTELWTAVALAPVRSIGGD